MIPGYLTEIGAGSQPSPFNPTTIGQGAYRGTYEVAGGTGKFTGITGSGEAFSSRAPIRADDKWPRHVVSNKVAWKPL